MQLLCLLTVVAVLAASEIVAPQSFGLSPVVRAVVGLGLMASVVAFACVVTWGAQRALDASILPSPTLLQRFDRGRRRHMVAWCVAALGAVYLLDWQRLTPDWVTALNWLVLDKLFMLAPIVGPLVFSWALFYEVDCEILRRRRLLHGEPAPVRSLVRYLMKNLGRPLGLIVAAGCLFWLTSDLAKAASIWIGASAGAGLQLPLSVGLILVALPWFMVQCWQTTPLASDGQLGRMLGGLVKRLRVAPLSIRLWETDSRMANAAVLGMVPPVRYVLLSDDLLRILTLRQVAAVFSHELAHIYHWHYLWRGLAVLVPLALATTVDFVASGFFPAFAETMKAHLGESGLQGIVLVVGLAVYLPTGFSHISRRLEVQADLTACRILSADLDRAVEDDPPPIPPAGESSSSAEGKSGPVRIGAITELRPEAVDELVRALHRVAAWNQVAVQTADWQHFSVAQRVALLRSFQASPEAVIDFERRLWFLQAGLALLLLATTLALILPR